MKKSIYYITIFIAFSLLFCKKDEVKVTLSSNPVPAVFINPVSGADLVLSADQGTSNYSFIWKSPNYGFKASVQSRVQLDTANNNFKSLIQFSTTFSDTLLVAYSAFNKLLVNSRKLPKNKKSSIEIRLMTMTDIGSDTVYSVPIKMTVTTY
jgi:hypothetical protein